MTDWIVLLELLQIGFCARCARSSCTPFSSAAARCPRSSKMLYKPKTSHSPLLDALAALTALSLRSLPSLLRKKFTPETYNITKAGMYRYSALFRYRGIGILFRYIFIQRYNGNNPAFSVFPFCGILCWENIP
jgi:DNA-directed RNA polymerase subunit RPC12/RpoP